MFELIQLTTDLAVLRFKESYTGAELADLKPKLTGRDIIVDFPDVQFLSSQVLASLLMLQSSASASARRVVLAGLAPDLQKICAITKIDHLFMQAATVDEGRELLEKT